MDNQIHDIAFKIKPQNTDWKSVSVRVNAAVYTRIDVLLCTMSDINN
jgi:hypothetical protein